MEKAALWSNPDFRWLLIGQTVSQFGSSVTGFAMPWLILQLTGSALQMGVGFAVGFLPYLLLSLPAGVWADQYNRKHIMVMADLARGILTLVVPITHWLGRVSVVEIYVVMALISVFNALFDASSVSCVPNIVEKYQVRQANSAMQAGTSASQVVGPVLAGIAVTVMGAPNTMIADAVSYFVSAATLIVMKRAFSTGARKAQAGLMQQIAEGLQYVWTTDLIRMMALFAFGVNLGGSAARSLLLYRLQHDLHVSAYWSGLVMTGGSVGTILGSVVSAVVATRFRMGLILMVSLFFLSVPDFIIAWTTVPSLIGVANVIYGIAAVMWNIQSMSFRQSIIPDEMLGRVSSSTRIIVWGANPIGNTLGGIAGQWFGAPAVFVAASTLRLIIWLAGWRTKLYKSATAVESMKSSQTPVGN